MGSGPQILRSRTLSYIGLLILLSHRNVTGVREIASALLNTHESLLLRLCNKAVKLVDRRDLMQFFP
jgi:hypothetical protein